MSRFLKFQVLVFVLTLGSLEAFSQSKSPFNIVGPEASIDKILSENARYPAEALKDRLEGEVLFSIKITEAGEFDSLLILESTHPLFETEALKTLSYLKTNWYPELLGEKPVDRRYLLYFKFATYLNQPAPDDLRKQAQKWVEKGKYEKAVKLLEELVLTNTYSIPAHELLWQAYTGLEETENAQKEYLKITYLKKEFLGIVEISAIGISRMPVPIN